MPGETTTGTSIVPWHMWGDSKTVEVATSGGLVQREESQILRINYGRPESWCFVLGAQIVDQSGQNDAGTLLTCAFTISVGVGRSVLTIPGWHLFTFDFGGVSPIGRVLWTNTVANRVGVVAGAPDVFTTTSWIDSMVAQDIQLKTTVALDSVGEATRAKVAMHAYFAPKTHIRPEWFLHHFPGNEHKGT